MILKARQFGVSTHCLIEMFDYTIFNRNVTTCILAHKQDAIEKLFRIPRRAYDFMHPDLRPALDRGGGSKYEMYFPNLNSRIYCDLTIRGDTIQKLHVSEAAFIKDQDGLLATLQAVPIDGQVTMETTPNGMGSFFYDMWNDPDQSASRMFFPWYLFPDYAIQTRALRWTEEERQLSMRVLEQWGIHLTHEQVAFRRLKKAELKKLFIQEYPEDDASCFLASGSAAMDLLLVKEQLDKRIAPHSQVEPVTIYKPYIRDRLYACGADCSEGVGGDYSVAVMFDVKTREQVAVLRGQFKPFEFAQKIVELCETYTAGGRGYPLLAVERNNHGHAVLSELENHLYYPNLYFTDEERTRVGWLTDKVTRPILLDCFIDGVENRTVVLNDTTTLNECLTLIVNDVGKIEAAPKKHDDCVMASAIALQMCIECAPLAIYDNIKEKILI